MDVSENSDYVNVYSYGTAAGATPPPGKGSRSPAGARPTHVSTFDPAPKAGGGGVIFLVYLFV